MQLDIDRIRGDFPALADGTPYWSCCPAATACACALPDRVPA
jgi:hypothetical protein